MSVEGSAGLAAPYPSRRWAFGLAAAVFALVVASAVALLSVEDSTQLKALIEDSGPVQMVGQTAIACACGLAMIFAVWDSERRREYILLSYLLLFYALREADYHYKVSEHAKATQFKRFFSHEQIPLYTKLALAAAVVLFLVVLYQYLREQKPVFTQALKNQLPWALFCLAWAVCFFLSQAIDQTPFLHNTAGQVYEELLESTAEVLALLAMLLFRAQCHGERRALRPKQIPGEN